MTCHFCPRAGRIRAYGKMSCVLCPVCAFEVEYQSAIPEEIECDVSVAFKTICADDARKVA